MHPNKAITKYDVLFFYECCCALFVNAQLLHWTTPTIIALILIGLTFEVVTCSSWSYSEVFKRSFFVVEGTDISIAAAFSWAGVLMIFSAASCAIPSDVLFPNMMWVVPTLIVGVGGNIIETLCFRWGMFTYNNTPVTRMFFLPRPIFIWGVPLAVRLGYFMIFGPLCSLVLHLNG